MKVLTSTPSNTSVMIEKQSALDASVMGSAVGKPVLNLSEDGLANYHILVMEQGRKVGVNIVIGTMVKCTTLTNLKKSDHSQITWSHCTLSQYYGSECGVVECNQGFHKGEGTKDH